MFWPFNSALTLNTVFTGGSHTGIDLMKSLSDTNQTKTSNLENNKLQYTRTALFMKLFLLDKEIRKTVYIILSLISCTPKKTKSLSTSRIKSL